MTKDPKPQIISEYENARDELAYKVSTDLVGLYEKSCGFDYFIKGYNQASVNSPVVMRLEKVLLDLKHLDNKTWHINAALEYLDEIRRAVKIKGDENEGKD